MLLVPFTYSSSPIHTHIQILLELPIQSKEYLKPVMLSVFVQGKLFFLWFWCLHHGNYIHSSILFLWLLYSPSPLFWIRRYEPGFGYNWDFLASEETQLQHSTNIGRRRKRLRRILDTRPTGFERTEEEEEGIRASEAIDRILWMLMSPNDASVNDTPKKWSLKVNPFTADHRVGIF